jgi:hypothetical protein
MGVGRRLTPELVVVGLLTATGPRLGSTINVKMTYLTGPNSGTLAHYKADIDLNQLNGCTGL